MSDGDARRHGGVGRVAFAHEAVLAIDADGDTRAPGGAVTLALCGTWEHDPPCPLAPHHSSADRIGPGEVRLRTLFAVEPTHETRVRQLIDHALAVGHLDGPNGQVAWRLISSGPASMQDDDRTLADSLVWAP